MSLTDSNYISDLPETSLEMTDSISDNHPDNAVALPHLQAVPLHQHDLMVLAGPAQRLHSQETQVALCAPYPCPWEPEASGASSFDLVFQAEQPVRCPHLQQSN